MSSGSWVALGIALLVESALAVWAWSGLFDPAPALVHLSQFGGILAGGIAGLPGWAGMLISFGFNSCALFLMLRRWLDGE